MADLNTLSLTGRLTRDPEVRTVPSGDAVCSFRIASNGVKEDDTIFIDVDVWGGQAEPCGQYLRQGSRVGVSGRLSVRDWVSKDGQSSGRAVECAGARVSFLETKAEAEAHGQAPAAQPATTPQDQPPPPEQKPLADDDIPF